MKSTLVLSFVKITPFNVTFCTSNHVYQIYENPEHCSLKIYPLTTFLNPTDNGNKSLCALQVACLEVNWKKPGVEVLKGFGS